LRKKLTWRSQSQPASPAHQKIARDVNQLTRVQGAAKDIEQDCKGIRGVEDCYEKKSMEQERAKGRARSAGA
jgi:hypothetical protein